jgi:hypothetical protein
MVDALFRRENRLSINHLPLQRNVKEDSSLLHTNRLTLLPLELLESILSLLDLTSLQNVTLALFDLLSVERGRVFHIYSERQTSYLGMLRRLFGSFSSALQYSQERRIIECDSCTSSMNFSSARERLEAKSRILEAPFFDLNVFLNSRICECCEEGLCRDFGRISKLTPPSLCHLCEERMRGTLVGRDSYRVNQGNNGYAWVCNSEMRRLCGLSKQVRAPEFAREHAIRRTLSKNGVERFLLRDLVPYFKCTGEIKPFIS